ncbi:CopD family protein [Aquibium oceanicum]|nr:CopD family protein [Aquibium oceanicum]
MMAAGAWLGALPFVIGLLSRLERLETRAVLMRYSGEGHVWVAAVLVTGLTATLWIFDGIPLDWSVRYQSLWALKVFVTLLMVGLAIRNRYFLVPRLGAGPETLRAIAKATKAEVGLGLVAVTLVAWFGTLEPR